MARGRQGRVPLPIIALTMAYIAYLTDIFRNAITRLAEAPQRITPRPFPAVRSAPPPAYVTARLENVFEELSELALQPHVAAAFELACDVLQAELPVEVMAAGLHDIDADEMRFLLARGADGDLLRGTALPRSRCLTGLAAEHATIVRGDAEGAGWIGSGKESTILLCPIIKDATLLGVLALADPLCTASFSEHDLELVGYVSEQLAGFIHTHRHQPAAPA